MPKKANTASSLPCPKCKAPGSEQRRNGTQAGRQRWQCKACKRTWTEQPQAQVMDQDGDGDFTWEDARRAAEFFCSDEFRNSEAGRKLDALLSTPANWI